MKRPPDPLMCMDTMEKKGTGARKQAEIDDVDSFDVDIDEFDLPDGTSFDSTALEPFSQNHPRTHKPMIDQSNILDMYLVSAKIMATSILEQNNDPGSCNNKLNKIVCNQDKCASGAKRDYPTILTFIEGALVGTSGDIDNDESHATLNASWNNSVPTLPHLAKSCSTSLDKKQYIAYEVICCTFLLQLLYKGGNEDTALGSYLNASLQSGCG